MTVKRRARHEDQKEARRQSILQAAWELFQQRRYDDINVIDVARAVGLAKGTVYLYFKTKEALFLEVQKQQFLTLFDTLDAQLNQLDTPATIQQVTTVITQAFIARPALNRLFAILHVVLERNIDYETAVNLKRAILARMLQTGQILEETLSCLGSGQGAAVLQQAYALMIGVQHLADPAAVVLEVFEKEPTLRAFEVDFGEMFATTLHILLIGIEAKAG